MSHRERLAWVTVISLLVPYVPYAAWVARSGPPAPMPDLGTMKVFAMAALAQLAIYSLGALALRVRWPADATAKPDERDLAIKGRSLVAAYGMLVGGALWVGCFLPFYKAGWTLINTTIAAVVLAELVRCGVAIWSYRRG